MRKGIDMIQDIIGLLIVIFIGLNAHLQTTKYKTCKKKCSGKKCSVWPCEYSGTCSEFRKKGFSYYLHVLHRAGFRYYHGDKTNCPAIDFEFDEVYPVRFTRDYTPGFDVELSVTVSNREEIMDLCNFIKYADKNLFVDLKNNQTKD